MLRPASFGKRYSLLAKMGAALKFPRMQLPHAVPVMTLPGATLFPQALLPLYIFEPRYRKMLVDSLHSHRMFSVAMQKPGRVRETPCPVAGLGLIRVSVGHNDGTSHLILQGLTRVELMDTMQYKPYRVQAIRPLAPDPADNVVIDALLAKMQELVAQLLKKGGPSSLLGGESMGQEGSSPAGSYSVQEVLQYLERITDADQAADLVTCALLSNAEERQEILETIDLVDRLKRLIRFLLAELERHGNPPLNDD